MLYQKLRGNPNKEKNKTKRSDGGNSLAILWLRITIQSGCRMFPGPPTRKKRTYLARRRIENWLCRGGQSGLDPDVMGATFNSWAGMKKAKLAKHLAWYCVQSSDLALELNCWLEEVGLVGGDTCDSSSWEPSPPQPLTGQHVHKKGLTELVNVGSKGGGLGRVLWKTLISLPWSTIIKHSWGFFLACKN